jgi:pyruvate dehydrogenase E2 component (dihydrolipoamide acetyltransferase)
MPGAPPLLKTVCRAIFASMTKLRMPDLGTVEGNVTLVRWLKAEGDTVALGEPLFEVETDKGVSEVEAAIPGVLVKKVVPDGGTAGAGETIALLRRPGETDDPASPDAAAPAAAARQAASAMAAPQAAPAAPHAIARTLRALAAKRGVDLSAVKPTGTGGRLTREDVLRARDVRPAPAAAASAAAAAPGALALSRSQAIVAGKVSQSHREKPVYRVNAVIDMSSAIAIREKGKAAGEPVSWDAIFVKAAAMAVTEMPLFRRYITGQPADLAEHPSTDIAVAIGIAATNGGGDDLFIPAVRGPAAKGAAIITREIEALAGKARTRSLQGQEAEGSCFLVSNLGMFPIDSFDAIIYPDHAAALAVGALVHTPVSDGKSIRIAPMMRVSLAVDHRLINGKSAARFLSRVKNIIETGAFA